MVAIRDICSRVMACTGLRPVPALLAWVLAVPKAIRTAMALTVAKASQGATMGTLLEAGVTITIK